MESVTVFKSKSYGAEIKIVYGDDSADDNDASTNAVVATVKPLTASTSCEVCLVHTVIRVSRLCHMATSGSVNRAQTKWNVRVVVVPSAAQTFR